MIIKIWSLLITILAFTLVVTTIKTNKKTEFTNYTRIKFILDMLVFTACAILGIMTWFNAYNALRIPFIFIPYLILRVCMNLVHFVNKTRQKVFE